MEGFYSHQIIWITTYRKIFYMFVKSSRYDEKTGNI